MVFQLRASLDPGSIRQAFFADGFAHIPGVLSPEGAESIYRCLAEDTAWSLVFNDRDRHIDIPEPQAREMPKESADELRRAILGEARDNFQYCYRNYPVYDAYRAGRDSGHLLHRFYEFLNGDEFLRFARAATGFEDIAFADAQATCFLPGHFLTTHDDTSTGKHRRVAYVFNFTPHWRPDWGGYLQMLDDAGHIRRGLLPSFNALNILSVPQRHNVSFVAPFAGGARLAISGWLRYGEAP